MMKNYKYLEKLVNEVKDKPEYPFKSGTESGSESNEKSFDQIYCAFFRAVKYFNNACGMDLISINNLSVDIFKLILKFDQFNACFYLLSRHKYVFVFNENSGQIVFFGRHNMYSNQNMNVSRNFTQLFRLDCELKDGIIQLKDNTGNEISSEEVICQIFKWLML